MHECDTCLWKHVSRVACLPYGRAMAPKQNKRRAAATARPAHGSSARPGRDSSDEEDVAAAGSRDDVVRNKRPPFDKDAILATVMSLAAPNRLPAVFGDAEIVNEWRQWHADVPTTLDEVPSSARLQRMAMPMKCTEPSEKPQVPVAQPRRQVELLTYANKDGRKLDGKELQRNAQAVLRVKLTTDDLPVGSTIALHAPEGANPEDILEGEGTPFLVADVVAVECSSTSTSASASQGAASSSQSGAPASKQQVVRILVHYRMPYAGTKCSNDPSKPWHLACLCRLPYSKAHETRRECKSRMSLAPVSAQQATTKFLDWLETDRVLETKLNLTDVGRTLTAETKRRLVEDITGDAQLAERLGLKLTETKQERKAKARKKALGGEAFT